MDARREGTRGGDVSHPKSSKAESRKTTKKRTVPKRGKKGASEGRMITWGLGLLLFYFFPLFNHG